jgi:hypothetical protein
MNIHEQLESILAGLGVEMEHDAHEHDDQYDENEAAPEVSIFQASRDHYGVFYRLDIIDAVPQLRILVPIEQGPIKMEMYLVRMSSCLPLNTLFSSTSNYQGSSAFAQGREAALQHLLYAVAEMMKHLFWSGDLNTLSFPPEIEVRRLL